jgi:isoamylase
MTRYQIRAGSPAALGATHDGEGVNFAVFSENAARMELCLFSPDGMNETHRLALPEKSGPIWHGHIPGLKPGARYGYRAHGAYDPERGHRFNANKLLMDPYARELSGSFVNSEILMGYDPSSPALDMSFDKRDSAASVPKSVVAAQDGGLAGQAAPGGEAPVLIYEAHVRGLTRQMELVPEEFRGTYEGLACEPVLEHLQKLGVTAVELLPVHSMIDELFLLRRGLSNYWGYNTVGFFTPEPRYFGPAGIAGFREMVARFRAAGIEVVLDVVYNHTGEGDQLGPTICYRGLDNAAYYRLVPGQPRYYINDTGCGNTMNVSHPHVLRMVMDSLRYWVETMGVGGFRFDLATTLGREDHGFDVHGGFFDVIRQDPVLANVRLIAEPWDVGPGGYRVGEFPHPFLEWNDGFRDTARKYWRGDSHSTQHLASCLLGSASRFDRGGRPAGTSVNFIAAHDGFTLADVTRYNEKHNEANGDNNSDGHHANFSDNCGTEGETGDSAIRHRRALRQRNMLATLFLSQGTPMLLAGDEIGNSQDGNNNAYCQDNAISWIDWNGADPTLLAFVQRLSRFRQTHRSLWQSRFLHGAVRETDGQIDVEWRDFDGGKLNWRDPDLSRLCLLVRCSAEAPRYDQNGDAVFMAFNGEKEAGHVALPEAPDLGRWVRALDTANPDEAERDAEALESVAPKSIVAFAISKARPAPARDAGEG